MKYINECNDTKLKNAAPILGRLEQFVWAALSASSTTAIALADFAAKEGLAVSPPPAAEPPAPQERGKSMGPEAER